MVIRPIKPHYDINEESEKNTIGTVLLKARQEAHLTQPEVITRLNAYGINITVTAYSKWEKGTNVPNAYQLFALSDALHIPDITLSFMGKSSSDIVLLNEIGQKKVADYIHDLVASGLYVKEEIAPSEKVKKNCIRLKVFSMAASAGTGSFVDSDQYEYLPFPKDEYEYNTDFGVKVTGDSMEPMYHDGQIVCVQKEVDLNPGDIGIFAFDGMIYIKKIDVEKTSSGKYRRFLVSLNPAYKPMEIFDDSSFTIIGKVLS